jgi:hypothetical protein
VEASGGLVGGQFILRVQQGASRRCHWVLLLLLLLLRNGTTRGRRTQDPYLLVLRSLVEDICDGKCIHADIIHWWPVMTICNLITKSVMCVRAGRHEEVFETLILQTIRVGSCI